MLLFCIIKTMAEAKYKKFYQLLSEQNKDLLKKFQEIHNGYAADPKKWEAQFHSVGRDVLDVMRDWERRLCSGTEKSHYAQYSSKLAEKYWEEIKKDFPLIEQVGVHKSSK